MDFVLIFLTNVVELDLFCTVHVDRSSPTFTLFYSDPKLHPVQDAK